MNLTKYLEDRERSKNFRKFLKIRSDHRDQVKDLFLVAKYNSDMDKNDMKCAMKDIVSRTHESRNIAYLMATGSLIGSGAGLIANKFQILNPLSLPYGLEPYVFPMAGLALGVLLSTGVAFAKDVIRDGRTDRLRFKTEEARRYDLERLYEERCALYDDKFRVSSER